MSTTPNKQKAKYKGLIEYLESRLGRAAGSGAELTFSCPFCIDAIGSESSGKKFYFNTTNLRCYCFRCETGFRALEPFFKRLNGGYLKTEEIALLKNETRMPAVKLTDAIRSTFRPELPSILQELKPRRLPSEYKYLGDTDSVAVRRGHQYLEERGISREDVEKFRIGYCPFGEYAQRLIFPVYQNGQQVYFTSRYCGKHFMKAKNPPNDPERKYHSRDTVLLNYDNVMGQKVVCISEGAFSVMAHENAVGLMGKIISDIQIILLERLIAYGLEEVVIALDADALGKAEEIKNRLVGKFPRVTILKLDYGDPDDRKADLPALMEQRVEELTLSEKVRARFVRHK